MGGRWEGGLQEFIVSPSPFGTLKLIGIGPWGFWA